MSHDPRQSLSVQSVSRRRKESALKISLHQQILFSYAFQPYNLSYLIQTGIKKRQDEYHWIINNDYVNQPCRRKKIVSIMITANNGFPFSTHL